MRYIGVEVTDITTNKRFWFCKDLPGWRFPGGGVARLLYQSFAARKRYAFQRYEIIPHIAKRPTTPTAAGVHSAHRRQ